MSVHLDGDVDDVPLHIEPDGSQSEKDSRIRASGAVLMLKAATKT
jgi:hypothetical protein